MNEIRRSESVLKSLSPNSANYPEMVHRLATNYWEEAQHQFQLEIFNLGLRCKAWGGASSGEREPEFVARESGELVAQASQSYLHLLKASSAYSRRDEAFLSLGRILVFAEREEEALSMFETLVTTFPKSSHRAAAWWEMGEIYFGQRDLRKAEQGFSEVMKDRNSRYFHKAMYKKALCSAGLGKTDSAIEQLKSLVKSIDDYLRSSPLVGSTPKKALRKEALASLAEFYVRDGKLTEARSYFSRLGELATLERALR